MSIPIHSNLLAYSERLQARELTDIAGIVMHCTETPDLASAREYGEIIHYQQTQTGNSGHFYIDVDGRIEQYVPLQRIAHHVSGHNKNTIGIELVNRGRYPHWLHSQSQQMTSPYPAQQINALIMLLQQLQQQLPALSWIAGHEDLDQRLVNASNNPKLRVRRKLDPGPMFPWQQIMQNSKLERIYP
jgi:N-acetylmuramoyl-L-alanine amidase